MRRLEIMRVKDGEVNRQSFNAAVVIVVDHFPQKCNHQMKVHTYMANLCVRFVSNS